MDINNPLYKNQGIHVVCTLFTVKEGEADAYIMREMTDQDGQGVYETVEDDEELDAVSKIFSELLEDIELGI